MKVKLRYNFIFDPNDTWQTEGSFQLSFGKYLEALGLQAELVETQEDDEKYVFITKAPRSPAEQKAEQPTIKQQKAKLTAKRDYDGKYSR